MKTNSFKLFLDDQRFPKEVFKCLNIKIYQADDWVIVRNFTEFVSYIEIHGLPSIVSFDNDIADFEDGVERTGYDCVKWLCNYCQDNDLKFPEWHIHSGNNVGVENIERYIKNYKRLVETNTNTDALREFIKNERKKQTFLRKLKNHYLSWKYRLQDYKEKLKW